MDELELLLQRAKSETDPQSKAVLWGECILHVLSLEDIREGLTFDELRGMSDGDAMQAADHMQSVFEMRSSWRDVISDSRSTRSDSYGMPISSKKTSDTSTSDNVGLRAKTISKRKSWPLGVARSILVKCHFRCCVCPEHRRVADIHHIDGNNSNSVEVNGVALCKLCHTDAHTTSTMQRNLQSEHLQEFKRNWEAACKKLANSLSKNECRFRNVYYMNVHRLDALLREIGEDSVLSKMPHQVPERAGTYNTLWANPANPLSWSQLLKNRNYFESRLNDALNEITTIDLNLLEVEALDASEYIGALVTFDCQFFGRDIPCQNELVENWGRIAGPQPTMRRELSDPRWGRFMKHA